jgi:hypothetical protein
MAMLKAGNKRNLREGKNEICGIMQASSCVYVTEATGYSRVIDLYCVAGAVHGNYLTIDCGHDRTQRKRARLQEYCLCLYDILFFSA